MVGALLVNQAFDPDQFEEGVLYMPDFDVCVQALETGVDASVELTNFDGSEAQSWVFVGEGMIAPASAPDVCLTLTGETRTDRSDENQMIALTLQDYSDEFASTQSWASRTAN